MKTHVHIIYYCRDSKKFCAKVLSDFGIYPVYHKEPLWLDTSIVPDEIWNTWSSLMLDKRKTDPIVRLYAEVDTTLQPIEFNNWEVRLFTQDQVDDIVSVINTVVHLPFASVVDAIKQSLPDIPDAMIGLSILNSVKIIDKE